jgi:opacity protein-like surface antigen
MAMSKRIFVAAGLLAALGLGATPAAAQGLVTPFIGAVFGGDVPASRATYGVSFVSNHGPIGAELELGYTPTLYDVESTKAKLATVMGNVLIGLPLGAFHPYASAGLGLMRQRTSASPAALLNDITDNDFGYSLGGGAWAMVSSHVGVRADLRFFQVRKTDGFNFGRGYGGLVFKF